MYALGRNVMLQMTTITGKARSFGLQKVTMFLHYSYTSHRGGDLLAQWVSAWRGDGVGMERGCQGSTNVSNMFY